MRLLYHYVARNLKKNKSRLILDGLKSGVAASLKHSSSLSQDYVYSFITTSRPVEKWLQRSEEQIRLMSKKKVQVEISMIIGGYGAGKTHIKDYLTRNKIDDVLFLELNLETMKEMNQNNHSAFVDVYSFILLNFKHHLEILYDRLLDLVKKDIGEQSPRDLDDAIKLMFKEFALDGHFVKALCSYGGLGKDRGDYKQLEGVLLETGHNVFFPLMKMYKKYMGIKGMCIFVDELEYLQYFQPEKRALFVASLREFHDAFAETFLDSYMPSCKVIILCTLSFWNEIITDTRSQALETRVDLFEIPPLVEDEIMAIAEKLYALYRTSGQLKSEIIFDSKKLQAYLIGKAALDAPLTPRFVIEQLMKLIEFPEDYIRYLYQP